MAQGKKNNILVVSVILFSKLWVTNFKNWQNKQLQTCKYLTTTLHIYASKSQIVAIQDCNISSPWISHLWCPKHFIRILHPWSSENALSLLSDSLLENRVPHVTSLTGFFFNVQIFHLFSGRNQNSFKETFSTYETQDW